ncbi:hypothetical protein H4F05_01840 [Vibrio cholerae]
MRRVLALFAALSVFSASASSLVIRITDRDPITLSHEDIVANFEPTTFSTTLPWFDGKKTFTGFKVSSLVDYYRATNTFSVSFVALNDYAASSRIEDILKYEPIVAYEMDGEKMKVRNKGPYWLVFNLSQFPEIDNAAFRSQMVWQIDEILVHTADDESKE